MPLSPIKRLRKGVVLITLLFIFFVPYRLFFSHKEITEDTPTQETESPITHTEICLLISEKGPVNVDTVFNIKDISVKIFAYSFLEPNYIFNVEDTLLHVWYNGSEMVKSIPCEADSLSCTSYLSIESLKHGIWSVDVKQNNVLLNVRQFKVE